MAITFNLPPQMESELIATAQAGGVTVEELVTEALLSNRPRPVITGAALVAAMQKSPHKDVEIEPERVPMSHVRDVEL